MPNIQQLQQHIIYRLVLAKTIFKKAAEFCEIPSDIFSFSHGLIALHDSLDNFTGAIASQQNLLLPQKIYLWDTINKIEAHEKIKDPSFLLKSKSEINQLNTIRNNIKHLGIMPDTNSSKNLISPIIIFFKEYSKYFFNLDWEVISLAELIKDPQTRKEIKTVEELIEQGRHKEALDSMAMIKFEVFDELSLKIKLDPKYDLSPPSEDNKKLRASENIFPKQGDGWFSDLYDRADYLEKGINRDLMHKFEELTAKVGVNNSKEWKYIKKHEGQTWAEPNWTKENALFCYDFLVDAILKNQRKNVNFIETWVWTIYSIIAKNQIKIFDKSENLIYTMNKGEKRSAIIFSRIDKNWEIFDEGDLLIELLEENSKSKMIGYVKMEDKENIRFIETRQYIRDKKGNFILRNKVSGG